ncbi:MAG TPA: PAS domain S-box protein, partial [Marinagarivorans sp.]|nr:PAS domain S-box protein [Marinagarivorans sp.]
MQQTPTSDQDALGDDRHALLQAYGTDLLDAVPAGIIVLNEAGIIVYCNSEVARLFAYDLSELQGQPVETLMPQAYRQQHVQLRQDYFTQSTPRFMGLGRDLFGQRKDGSQFPVEIGLRPLMVGMQQFVVASILDISERKKAHEQLATVIDSSPYGKLVVDKSGVIRLVNHRLVDLFGYSKEQLLGQAI